MDDPGALRKHWNRQGGGHRPAAPLEVFWTASGLCNLACDFCMTSSGPTPARPGLDRAGRARVLAELVQARVLKVYLTGGEPLVLPDVWELLEGLLGAGVFVELTTNGTHLDATTCARLGDLGVSSLQVSLNGADEASNAPRMGEGTYRTILAGIRRALHAGLPVHVRPTVQAGNVRALPELIRQLAELGVPQVDLREVTPLGRAAGGFPARRPPPEELEEFERFCGEWEHPHTRVHFESWTLAFAAREQPAGCTLGDDRPATVLIDEAGHLAGCSATFYLGWNNSVLEHGLVGAWDRLPALKRFRDPAQLGGACAPCEIRDTCQGGCRAAAARLTGDVHAPDPLCPRLDEPVPDVAAGDLDLWDIG
jgi:pyrroloquinoline quinone biosynthesis protein E